MLAAKITRKVVILYAFFFFFTEYSSVVIVTYTMCGMLRVRGIPQRWGFHEFFSFPPRKC
jgi:hypothetical protein